MMKVLPFKIPRNNGEYIMVQHDCEPFAYDILHQHPELQITLIRESSGTAIVGGHIGEFEEGDVFIIGSNIPHVFRNDAQYYDGGPSLKSDIINVFLDEKIPTFDSLTFAAIESFFSNAKQGIKLTGSLRGIIAEKIDKLLIANGLDKLITVLEIIKELSVSKDFFVLNSESVQHRIDENDGKRLNDVIQFTFANYERRITLEEIAEVANMVPSAFCRFFKQRTRKTYFDFLNEIRIRRACKLLMNKDLAILEICYQSGFNNLSYFNRKFKEMTGYSPLKYYKAMKGS